MYLQQTNERIKEFTETNNHTSEYCTSLPPEILYLQTDTTFPVSYGTMVTVSCTENRQLRGDEMITCNMGTEFVYQEKPKCNDLGKFV